MFTKKSLVLIGVEDENLKAVLTLENDGDLIQGRLRLYNFPQEIEGILSLGIYDNGKVRKCGLNKSGSGLYTFKTEPDIGETFSCAVVHFVGAKLSPVLFGSTSGAPDQEGLLAEIADGVLDKSGAKEVEKILDENHVEFDDSLQQEIDAQIEKEMKEEDKCQTCKYKRCFFGQSEQEEKSTRFIDEIKGQIDVLFSQGKPEEYLQECIPSSKFIRVEYDCGGEYYILGLIYDEDGGIKYVCYGVPGVYQKTPPSQLSGYPVWFPLDSEKKESFGYWLTYQDANSGESVKAVVE